MARTLLSALHAFEAAARGGSFRVAAEELLLTPSAISHAVRKLEAEIGTVLFLRDGRRMVLTPEGETLLRHVERGFAELRRGMIAVSVRGTRSGLPPGPTILASCPTNSTPTSSMASRG